MASASDHRAHAALQPADCLILLPQRLPAAVETSIGPPHYLAECTQSDAFLQPSLRARKGRANSNSLARDPRWVGGTVGVLAVLHTWTQRLIFHPHVHCLVTGGGLSEAVTAWHPT